MNFSLHINSKCLQLGSEPRTSTNLTTSVSPQYKKKILQFFYHNEFRCLLIIFYITEAVQITNNLRTDLTRTYSSELAEYITYRIIMHCLMIKKFDHANI